MKKFMLACLILFLSCLPAYSTTDFTPEQRTALQLEFDILGECMMEKSYPYVQFGFSTEVAVMKGLSECKIEGKNLVERLQEYGSTEEEMEVIVANLIKQGVFVIDVLRNEAAIDKMNKKKKERTL